LIAIALGAIARGGSPRSFGRQKAADLQDDNLYGSVELEDDDLKTG